MLFFSFGKYGKDFFAGIIAKPSFTGFGRCFYRSEMHRSDMFETTTCRQVWDFFQKSWSLVTFQEPRIRLRSTPGPTGATVAKT